MEFEKDYMGVEKDYMGVEKEIKKKKTSIDLEVIIDKPSTLDLNKPSHSTDKYKMNPLEIDLNDNNLKNKQSDLSKNQNQKIKGYYGGLKILTLLLEDGIPFVSKLMILAATLTIITSFILYAFEVDTFANSICPEKQYVSAFIYINLLILIPIMAFVLSLFNLELINKAPYQFKITFLRPWLLWGICPIFVLPVMIYDHFNCKMESPFYKYPASFKIIDSIGIFSLIIFGIFIGFLTCILSGLNCNGLMNFCLKVFFKIIFPLAVIVLNVMGFLLTFLQVEYFLPVLYFHNYVFYLLMILVLLFYVLIHGFKMQEKIHINEKIMEFSKINN